MGIHQRILESRRPDDVVNQGQPVLIINDLLDTGDNQERIRNHLYVELQGDIDLRPTCACGKTSISAGTYGEADPCPECSTVPKLTMDKSLESTLYLRCPPGVRALMFPAAIAVLTNAFDMGNFKPIDYLLNRRYRVPRMVNANARRLIEKFKEVGIERGYNYFVDNIDDIIAFMCKHKGMVDSDIVEFRKLYGKSMFTQHITFMSNLLFIIENSAGSKYYDGTFRQITDSVVSLIGIDEKSPKAQEDLIGKSLCNITVFYETHFTSMYNTRKGIMRQVLYAGKGITAMRCVVTANTEAGDYDAISLPWGPTIQSLHTHIVSRLLKQGRSLNDAYGFIQYSIHAYNDEMYALLMGLIADSPYKGLPCFIERYPILGAGSMLLMYATEIKKHPIDKSIGFPAISVRSSNMDYDGDMVHLMVLDEVRLVELLRPLEYHNVVLDRLHPEKISKNVELTKPIFGNLSRYMEVGDNLEGTPEQIRTMEHLFG
jgi:hypothetical protein